MKNIMIAIAILGMSFAANAQTVGLLIQPDFSKSYTRKGFFAESTIYKRIGVYSDYKLMNSANNYFKERQTQVNVGLSYKVAPNLKAFASTSVINRERTTYNNKLLFLQNPLKFIHRSTEHRDSKSVYQVGAIFYTRAISVLGGYEFDGARVTVGIGFNLK